MFSAIICANGIGFTKRLAGLKYLNLGDGTGAFQTHSEQECVRVFIDLLHVPKLCTIFLESRVSTFPRLYFDNHKIRTIRASFVNNDIWQNKRFFIRCFFGSPWCVTVTIVFAIDMIIGVKRFEVKSKSVSDGSLVSFGS